MTPDEVVSNLEDLKHRYEYKQGGIDWGSKEADALSSAILLIQDYQKLRERVSEEKIRIVINERLKNFPINEDMDGLSSRGVDYQNLLNRTSQQIVTYLQQPTEH